MANKINKIKVPISGTMTDVEIEDASAVHSVKTINGDSITGSTSNISLPNTAISNDEIDKLF